MILDESTRACVSFSPKLCEFVCVLGNLGHSCIMMSALRSWQPVSGVKSVGFFACRVAETLHPHRAEERDMKELS